MFANTQHIIRELFQNFINILGLLGCLQINIEGFAIGSCVIFKEQTKLSGVSTDIL